MVETAFGNQPVEDVVGKAVAGTVSLVRPTKRRAFVVMVAEGMAQGIGALGRQTAPAVFVGGGMAFAVGMGGQTTCGIVAEGLFAAVGIGARGEVLIGVVVVFGVLSQRIGNTRQLSFSGV